MPGTMPEKPDAEPVQPWEDLVLPYLLGELSPDEQKVFERMLREDALCKVRLFEAQRLLEDLRSLPREKLSCDLAPAILEKIAETNSNRVPAASRFAFPWATVLKVAAGVAVLACGSFFIAKVLSRAERPAIVAYRDAVPRADEAAEKAMRWLASVQEPSGAWDGAKWGGNRQNTLSLTGLALLALSSGDASAIQNSFAEQIDRAAVYLSRHQQPDGLIGRPYGGTRYEHAIATYALMEAYKHRPTKDLERVLDGALRYLLANRHGPTGDRERGSRNAVPVAPESSWALLAMKRAVELGWSEVVKSAEPDLDAVLSAHFNATDIMQGETDFYHWYFASTALSSADEDDMRAKLDSLQARIIATQLREGPYAGSWDLSDRFSTAGGRVYTTSLAALTLRIDRSSRRI